MAILLLTPTLPNLLVSTTCTKGGGGGGGSAGPSAISKTLASMNAKFFRILETSLNVLEMLELFT